MKCIYENSNLSLNNIHRDNKRLELILLKDSDGYGIAIFDHDAAIAVFDINYCPKCGRKLEVGDG